MSISNGPTITIEGILVRVFNDKVRCFVIYTPILNTVQMIPHKEARFKDFDLKTPFVDMLENIPDLYYNWIPCSLQVVINGATF